MKILSIEKSNNNRMMAICVNNLELLEGKLALQSLFNLLRQTDAFVDFCENKIIFVTAQYEDETEVSYHPNVLLNNKTTFDKYWNQIKNYVNEKFY